MKPQSCAFVAGILGAIAGLLPGQSATSRSEDQPVVKVIHDLVRARLGSKLVEWADMTRPSLLRAHSGVASGLPDRGRLRRPHSEGGLNPSTLAGGCFGGAIVESE